jgi:hypothetical protein
MTNHHDHGIPSRFAVAQRIRTSHALQDSNACNRLFRLRIRRTGIGMRQAARPSSPRQRPGIPSGLLLRRKLTPVVIRR